MTHKTWRFAFVFLLGACACAATGAQETATPTGKTKIRAITAFVRIDRGSYQIQMDEAVKFLKIAKTTFESRDCVVQTLRIATQPFPEYTQGMSHEEALQFFKNLDGIAQTGQVILAIGPAYLSATDGEAQADLLADILRNTKSISATVNVTNDTGVNWPAVRAAARVMKTLSDGTLHSEGNFRCAALANVPLGSPVFPAAYLTGLGASIRGGIGVGRGFGPSGEGCGRFGERATPIDGRSFPRGVRCGGFGLTRGPRTGMDLFGGGSVARAGKGSFHRNGDRKYLEAAVWSERNAGGRGRDHVGLERHWPSTHGIFRVDAAHFGGPGAGGTMERGIGFSGCAGELFGSVRDGPRYHSAAG